MSLVCTVGICKTKHQMGGKTLHEPLYKNIFQMVFRLKCEKIKP